MTKPEVIWQRFGESLDERAEYLWKLYRRYSRGNEQDRLTGPYLDIGAGKLVNAALFRQMAGLESAVGVDIRSDLTKSRDIEPVRADARALPFRNRSFELVTMISTIEHVQGASVCLSEALRVLRADGELFMQFPNRYFPIELHSSLCMYFYLPRYVRNRLADAADRDWMKDIDVPTPRKIGRMLEQLAPDRKVVVAGFSYPESMLAESRSIRALGWILKRVGILRVMPMGYIVLVSRLPSSLEKRE